MLVRCDCRRTLALDQRRRLQPRPEPPVLTAPNYSPLGFQDLLAYAQAYPGETGSALVAQANAPKYWVYQGVAVRGAGPGPTGHG